MELYFGSMTATKDGSSSHNLVTFAIPDIGVKFKAPFPAEDMALDYASLLTLLEFIDINPQLFANRALELYSNNHRLVEQINNRTVDEEDLAPFLQKVLEYRARMKYSINWIPRPEDGDRFEANPRMI